jgi:hypothetical protein
MEQGRHRGRRLSGFLRGSSPEQALPARN